MLTKQEMLDRAWRGLKAQGWRVCVDRRDVCVYFDPHTGRRCAWGHVDPEATPGASGSVSSLHDKGVGLAAHLRREDIEFACRLQNAHDVSCDGIVLEQSMRRLAAAWGLTIPDEAP